MDITRTFSRERIKVAIVGLGNVGTAAVESVLCAPDMDLCGIVRRTAREDSYRGVPIVEKITELGEVDVAVLCVPSRLVLETALPMLERGISTVDSFDIHSEVVSTRQALADAARRGGSAAVLSAGWDPGTDSVIRALFEIMAPRGLTETNFGPGLSMGHSVAVRAISGVRDAISITIPKGSSMHRRMVYVELLPDALEREEEIRNAILIDPYFSKDETHVMFVDDVNALKDAGHGVLLSRKGGSGETNNQRMRFSMEVDNPAMTAQIMVACARAVTRQMPGAYSMIELAPVSLLPGDPTEWVRKLV